VNREAMPHWDDLLQIANDIRFCEEDDAIIWHYNSTSKYSVQALYATVNNRTVRQIHTILALNGSMEIVL
jgi:hypothetical protein